jgi:hypothetical protein
MGAATLVQRIVFKTQQPYIHLSHFSYSILQIIEKRSTKGSLKQVAGYRCHVRSTIIVSDLKKERGKRKRHCR